MTFQTARKVCQEFESFFRSAANISANVRRCTCREDLKCAAAMSHRELSTRANTFRSALEGYGFDAVETYTQYEPSHELHHAVGSLAEHQPESVEDWLDSLDNLYKVVLDGLAECENTTENTPAEAMFADLKRQTELGICALTWSLRPAVD